MIGPESGPAIYDNGRRVILKWHKLRRAAADPPFSFDNLQAGLALDAVLEVDIRRLADGAWICLHDALLDDETDGRGQVAALTSEQARDLRIAGGDFPPPLLTDVVAEIARVDGFSGHVQLDLKEPTAQINADAVTSLAKTLGEAARHCVLSGYDWPALARVGAAIPGLSLGYDPYVVARDRAPSSAAEFEKLTGETLAQATGAAGFYLSHRFVRAALAAGVNPIEILQTNGAFVDVWTLDPSTTEIGAILQQVVAAGADQITTNAPGTLADLWARLT